LLQPDHRNIPYLLPVLHSDGRSGAVCLTQIDADGHDTVAGMGEMGTGGAGTAAEILSIIR